MKKTDADGDKGDGTRPHATTVGAYQGLSASICVICGSINSHRFEAPLR